MNIYLLIAAVINIATIIGHITMGSKEFLKPVLSSSADNVPKKVFHALFHYITVFFILSAVSLSFAAFNAECCKTATLLASPAVLLFIGINYILFTITQLIITLTSGIEKAPVKMFQWIFFLLIGVLTLIGSCTFCAGHGGGC
jgi:hypothetical protein